ncbi:sugar porter family MFS transporter [Liquorilactobacillus oeni]|uniref:Major facilitator superfamily permease n=1 Tax=Liquorilactobacillus oeni DSM 19972 TaxID=1423777 RepID=A0A0R1MDM3_9LACO|nr:sugar porter family MFS transporter [Liquorilactobacillus oeni]KRL05881.1 major facilitator superfamily permease [Liquorilactobacillus oeni DSM 19972]
MEKRKHNQRLSAQLSAYVIALGGFLFGYDTGVINGSLAFMSLKDQLALNAGTQGIVSSALVFGGIFGALSGGRVADKIGRRKLLRWMAILFVIAALGCTFAANIFILVIFRFILGLAVGAVSGLSPMYLSEISTPDRVDQNVNKNAIAIVLGQVIAFTVNAVLGNIWGDWHPIWRVMMLMAAIPAILMWVASYKIPDSPRWQILHGKLEDGKEDFDNLGFSQEVAKRSITAIQNSLKRNKKTISLLQVFRNKSLVFILIVGMSLALIQQISGVNTVMYYGTVVLEDIGLSRGSSLYGNILIGLASFVASIIGTRLIAAHNHRNILLLGIIGNAFFLGMLSLILQMHLLPAHLLNIAVLIFLTLFLASHQGIVSPATWLMISEIFPLPVKARFMAFATGTIWLANFIISLIYPTLIALLGSAVTFMVFSLTNVFSILLTLFLIKPKKIQEAKHLSIK